LPGGGGSLHVIFISVERRFFLTQENVFLVIGELFIEVLIIVNNVICQKVKSVVYFENITVEVTDTDNKVK
jgi:hypothetical protein